jgi:cyclopropane-fatty-acyl-phospholipid synthase
MQVFDLDDLHRSSSGSPQIAKLFAAALIMRRPPGVGQSGWRTLAGLQKGCRLRSRSLTSLRERFLDRLRDRFGDAAPPLRIVFWDGEAFDFASAPRVVLTLHSRRLLRLFLTGNMGRLAQAYVEGDLGVDGRVQDVLRVGIVLAETIGNIPLLRRMALLLARLPRRHSKARDAAAVRYHYDVPSAFYRLWLDREMIYSCAYFITGTEDFDTAQQQKLDHLCRKLRLRSGDRVLDIGCGWGGLLCWAAANYAVSGLGVTLSQPQCDEARARAAAQGLTGRVEFRVADYRDLPGTAQFDKIVSVGMYEHVGIANLPLYFATIGRLLKPGGLALNHGITAADRDGCAQGPPGGEFIDRFVFPGGAVPHISRALYEIAGSGLEILDMEDLRPHYPPTLLSWVSRLEAARDAATAAAGVERYRIWRIYMAAMAYAFDRGLLSVCQTLAQKPLADGPAPRPWTRAYQYWPAPAPPVSRGIEWDKL